MPFFNPISPPSGTQTLDDTYEVYTSAPAEIELDDTRRGIIVTDDVAPITGPMLALDASGGDRYFSVQTNAGGGVTLAVGPSASQVGINRTSPRGTLEIVQDTNVNGSSDNHILRLTGSAAAAAGIANSEQPDLYVNIARTVTFAGGSTLAAQRAVKIQAPTYAMANAATITQTATLAVGGAPSAGAGATIGEAFSIWSEAGTVRVDGGALELTTGSAVAVAPAGTGRIRFDEVTSRVQVSNSTGAYFDVLTAGTGGVGGTGNATKIPVWTSGTAIGDSIVTASSTTVTVGGNFVIAQPVISSGAPAKGLTLTGAAHTSVTDAEYIDADFALDRTVTFTSPGGAAHSPQRAVVFRAPTYAFSGAAKQINVAATVAITGAPAAGAQATLAASYAFWVQAGTAQFDGAVVSASTLTGTGAIYANGGVDRSTAAVLTLGGANATAVTVTPQLNASNKLAVGGTSVHQGTMWVTASNAGGLGGDLWVVNGGTNTLGSYCRISMGADGTTDNIPNFVIENVVTNVGSFLSDAVFRFFDGSALNEKFRFTSAGVLQITGTGLVDRSSAATLNLGTVTATAVQVGRSGQSVGLYGTTPVVKYATTGTTTGFTAGAGTAVNDDSTFTGNTGSTAYTIGDVVRALKLIGVMTA